MGSVCWYPRGINEKLLYGAASPVQLGVPSYMPYTRPYNLYQIGSGGVGNYSYDFDMDSKFVGSGWNVVYVSYTGNDTTGTGSIGAPYATLYKAISVASTPTKVMLNGGNVNYVYECYSTAANAARASKWATPTKLYASGTQHPPLIVDTYNGRATISTRFPFASQSWTNLGGGIYKTSDGISVLAYGSVVDFAHMLTPDPLFSHSYEGQDPTQYKPVVDVFVPNGSQTIYTLSYTPDPTDPMTIFNGGTAISTGHVVSANTIVFTTAPTVNDLGLALSIAPTKAPIAMQEGTYYANNTDLYVRLIADRAPDSNLACYLTGTGAAGGGGSYTGTYLAVRNIDFRGGGPNFNLTQTGATSDEAYFDACTFKFCGGTAYDSIEAQVSGICVNRNCNVSYSARDGWSFINASSVAGRVFELNSRGGNFGDRRLDRGLNKEFNASTVHDGTTIERVNCSYGKLFSTDTYGCTGKMINENIAYSTNYGVRAWDTGYSYNIGSQATSGSSICLVHGCDATRTEFYYVGAANASTTIYYYNTNVSSALATGTVTAVNIQGEVA
jgi:hypothetical protein